MNALDTGAECDYYVHNFFLRIYLQTGRIDINFFVCFNLKVAGVWFIFQYFVGSSGGSSDVNLSFEYIKASSAQ